MVNRRDFVKSAALAGAERAHQRTRHRVGPVEYLLRELR